MYKTVSSPKSPTGDPSQSTFLGRSNLDPHLISSADLQLFGVDLAQLLLKNHALGINRDLLDIHWGLSQQGYSCFFLVQRFNCLVSVHLQPPRLQRRDVRHRAGHVSFAAAWQSFDATPRLPEAWGVWLVVGGFGFQPIWKICPSQIGHLPQGWK